MHTGLLSLDPPLQAVQHREICILRGWVCCTLFCPYPFKPSCRFELGTWNSRVVRSSSEQTWSTILCSSLARRQLSSCLCLWYGNGNSQAVKSITNKTENFQGTEFVRT